MALLDILVAPHPILKAKASNVVTVDDDIRAFMDSMLETMYAAPGIGLAANQVGDLRRLVVVDCSDKEKPEPMYLINPQIEWVSDDDAVYEEGCLSVPELFAEVVRPASIQVSYLDRDGNKQLLETDGLLATCIQHEIDHLDGIMFMDHISALKRNMIMRKLKKWTKENGTIAILENTDPKNPVLNRHSLPST